MFVLSYRGARISAHQSRGTMIRKLSLHTPLGRVPVAAVAGVVVSSPKIIFGGPPVVSREEDLAHSPALHCMYSEGTFSRVMGEEEKARRTYPPEQVKKD